MLHRTIECTTVCIFFLSPGSDFVKKFMWSEILTTSIALAHQEMKSIFLHLKTMDFYDRFEE